MATKKAQRTALAISTAAAKQQTYAELKAVYKSPAKALARMLGQSETYLKGVRQEDFAKITDAIEAAEPRFFGMIENPIAVRDFVREVYGHDTGNEIAKRGAAAYLQAIEQMRVRANRAGFNIGKLDYAYLPRAHDVGRMVEAGRETWSSKVLPRVARERYLNDDGTRMTDAQLSPVLDQMYDTITTNGTNKMDPADFRGAGSRANRGAAHRELHFDGPDSELAYIDEFGRGSLFEAMESHVSRMSRDIGLVEEYGPNPQRHFDQLEAQAIKEGGGHEKMVGPWLTRARDRWNALSGYSAQSPFPRFAELNQSIRNVVVGTKLTSTLLSSVTDIPTLLKAAIENRMPLIGTIGEVFKQLGPEGQVYAKRLGIVSESMMADMNAWSANHLAHGGWTKKFADSTMVLSLLRGWTDALRRGFSISLMNTIARRVKTDWSSMAQGDRDWLFRYGIDESAWKTWQLVKPQDWRGNAILHPDSFDALRSATAGDAELRAIDRARSQLVGFIAKQSERAVLTAGMETQASLKRSLQKGTIDGEFAANLFLFKAYPMALIDEHIVPLLERRDIGHLGKMVAGTSFLATMGMFGALSTQLQQIAFGKDPIDMFGPHAGKFWAESFIRGGGLGIYGDLLYTGMGGQSRGGQPNWLSLAGPVYGSALDFLNLTLGNVGDAMQGKKTHIGAEALRFARGNLPGANVLNLWYTKAAVDHMFFHQLQEAASPGYLARMQQRAQQDYGQSYWWRPGSVTPDRAPNLAKMGRQ